VRRLTALLLLLAAPAGAADAPEWTLIPKDSSIGFTARQMSVPLRGAFEMFGGSIRFDPGNLEGSRVAIEIRPASARTRQKEVDAQLGQPDWFDAAAHPLARFEADRFLAKGEDRYEATGRLTIRGVAREVILPFTLKIVPVGDKLRAEAKGEVELKRLDFGIGQGEWRATNVVANEVQVAISVVAERAP
jgi:polyisoprenoid-binding protein YceI